MIAEAGVAEVEREIIDAFFEDYEKAETENKALRGEVQTLVSAVSTNNELMSVVLNNRRMYMALSWVKVMVFIACTVVILIHN